MRIKSKCKIKAVPKSQKELLDAGKKSKINREKTPRPCGNPKPKPKLRDAKSHSLDIFRSQRAIKASSQLPRSYRLLKSWRNKLTQTQSSGPSANPEIGRCRTIFFLFACRLHCWCMLSFVFVFFRLSDQIKNPNNKKTPWRENERWKPVGNICRVVVKKLLKQKSWNEFKKTKDSAAWHAKPKVSPFRSSWASGRLTRQ